MDINYWNEKASEYWRLDHGSLVKGLHPALRKEIMSGGKKILDFGCGEGRLCLDIPNKFELSLYDINGEAVKRAEKNIGTTKIKYSFYNKEDILKKYFDTIVCSMVLECIDSREEFVSTSKVISEAIKKGGKVIIGMTHPCFRNYSYSDFKAHFDFNKNSYFDNGSGFLVKMNDGQHETSFIDYHWSISFVIKVFNNFGFLVEDILEVKDNCSNSLGNKFVPPFIIYKFVKNE